MFDDHSKLNRESRENGFIKDIVTDIGRSIGNK